MRKNYFVLLSVNYHENVSAENEEEAITKVINNCPYEKNNYAEPFVVEIPKPYIAESEGD